MCSITAQYTSLNRYSPLTTIYAPTLSPTTQKIIDERREREKAFYENLFRSDNMLNTQLKMSEDGE